MTLVADVRPHPLSHDFVWKARQVARPRRLSAAQLAAFDARGFIKLEGVFTA